MTQIAPTAEGRWQRSEGVNVWTPERIGGPQVNG